MSLPGAHMFVKALTDAIITKTQETQAQKLERERKEFEVMDEIVKDIPETIKPPGSHIPSCKTFFSPSGPYGITEEILEQGQKCGQYH